ncbi:MAG: S9 family peptidase [Ktedonobacteraceae bacterium]|nr:S9 family peptidase [Ktedonobacteraceae bacterium]
MPTTRKDATVETYHGTPVADPYRWLEDAASAETLAWSEAQNAVAHAYLDTIAVREKLRARFTELWNYPKYDVPVRRSKRYFFNQNSGLQNQAVLYVSEGLQGQPRVVLDPNTLSSDGTVAVTGHFISEDGSLLAYSLSTSGSDWQEIKIRRVGARAGDDQDYTEVIQWCKFTSIAWQHDNAGFYYSRYPEAGSVPEEESTTHNRVYWHALGTQQSEDTLVYERSDAKELAFTPLITDDGQYLMLHVWHGTDTRNRFYYREVTNEGDFVRLLDDFDARYDFSGNDGPVFYFHTTLDAPRGRVIAIDIRKPEREHWREVVPESRDVVDHVQMVNQQLVVCYKHDAQHRLQLYTLQGNPGGEIKLPAPGSIIAIAGRPRDSELFLSFTSFLYPAGVYRYDFTSGTLVSLHVPQLTFDPERYETKQVFYTSKDGTRIPMFLTHKKGVKLDGDNPTLLYGYGGFDISLMPEFKITALVWVENGGVYAVPNLRGGGEYGEEWHHAGMFEKKQNVFDDFISAAEWLIASGYTSTPRLAINGGSNGGLLVAACMVQRPELYGAVVCRVPVTDMLRYHKFTVGRYWVVEYGNAEKNADHFRFLYAYSPLHNVREGVVYPPTLIMTADTDDRVVPAHAKKFAATLQAAQSGGNPILLRLEMKAGHGFGKPVAKVIEEESDMLAFLYKTLDMEG